MKIYIDIETIPKQPENETKAEIAKTIKAPASMKKPETIQDWHSGVGKYEGVKDAAIDEAYRKTALDGTYGEIISCVISDGINFYENSRDLGESEAFLLSKIFDDVDSLARLNNLGPLVRANELPYFIGHNIRFDLKFLWQRAIINKIPPAFKIPFNGRHSKDFYDTMEAWVGFNQRISQDNLCKALGIDGKRDEVKGSNVWDYVKSGQVSKVAKYNKHDVEDVVSIYNRINFLGEGK